MVRTMSKYFIDGFTTGSNPSTAGGYTITDQNGLILKQKFVKSGQDERPFTNNYTEFLAVLDCLKEFCKHGDTILTDSNNSISWAALRFPKGSKRKDLIPMAREVKELMDKLSITLEWIPRKKNLAGLVNEKLR